MKKIFFVLPLSVLLTYCSSSRKAVAPAPAGVSNVQVNGTANTSGAVSAGSQNRDWGYKASRDTAMNGSWQLEGMVAADGSWKTAESWAPVDTLQNMMDSAASAIDNSSATTTGSGTTGNTAAAGASTKSQSFSQRLYDTSTHFFDTTAFQQTLASRVRPFNYWQRLPEIRIMPGLGIFTGNTGCNSMSGSFNFNGTDLKIDNRIRTSKMACNEYDEGTFIADLLKADNYAINNNVLEFKKGNTTVLSFKKKV